MADSPTIRLRFDEASHESVTVTRVADRQFRLEHTPLLSPEPLHAGDVVEADALPDGTHRFRRVVRRGAMRHYSWVVPRAWADSEDRDAYVAKVEATGGRWEQVMGGVLHVHIPTDSDFDAAAELGRYLKSDWPEA